MAISIVLTLVGVAVAMAGPIGPTATAAPPPPEPVPSAPMDPSMHASASATATGMPTTPDVLTVAKVSPGDISTVGGSSSAGWQVSCPFSHQLSDDPIVAFGRPGSSHAHDFLGATTVNAFSTTATMQNPAAGTTCAAKDDKSGYWVPTLYKDGAAVHPTHGVRGPTGVKSRQTMYYRNPTGRRLHAFPAGLRMLSGNPAATSVKENPALGHDIWWGCSDNSISEKLVAPPKSCPRGMITVHIHFPNCWDGVHLDSPDHRSHVAFASGGKCPAGHPVIMPRLTIRNEYIVGTTTGRITLAGGDTFTIHGDFWNQWNQPALEKLVDDCFNRGRDCGKLGR